MRNTSVQYLQQFRRVALCFFYCLALSTGAVAQVKKLPSVTFVGVYAMSAIVPIVAWKHGDFERHGVNVKNFIFTSSASDTVSALQSDSAQFMVMAPEVVERANERGLGFSAIAGVYPEFWDLLVRKQEDSGPFPEALKGKKVSVTAPGSGSWAFLIGYLRSHGLSDRDVSIVPLGGLSSTLTGLKSGRVDASVTWEPGTAQALSEGYAVRIVNLSDPKVSRELYGSAQTLSQVIVAKNSFIERHPELAKQIYASLNSAIKWLKSANIKAVTEIMAEAAGVDVTPSFRAGVASGLILVPDTAALNRRAYDATSQFMVKMGILKKAQKFDSFAACKVSHCD